MKISTPEGYVIEDASEEFVRKLLDMSSQPEETEKEETREKRPERKKRKSPKVKRRNKTWTEEEKEYLRKHYPTTDNSKIAKKLGRTESAISSYAFLLGVEKADKSKMKSRLHQPWTEEEEEYLKENHDKKSLGQMALHIGRTPGAVENRLYQLGLK